MSNIREGPRRLARPFKFGARGLLILAAVVSILGFLLAPAFRAIQVAHMCEHCGNNLKMIGLALHEYYDSQGSFPPPFLRGANGRPMHSWRLAIEPYLFHSDFAALYDFDQAWDNPKNLKLAARWPSPGHCFECPAGGQPPGRGFTNYVMVVGHRRKPRSDDRAASEHKLDAIIVAEIADSDIHWTEPRDLNFDELSFKINDTTKPSISSHHARGALVLLADGTVRFLDESTAPEVVKALLTENLDDASGISTQSPPSPVRGD